MNLINRITLFFLLIIILSACRKVKDPTFQKFDNVTVLSANRETIRLSADLVLLNPNNISCTFKEMHLEVFTKGGVKLTEISQTYNSEMVARNTFSVPVVISIEGRKLVQDRKGILDSVLSALGESKVELVFKGKCRVEKAGVGINVPFEYAEAVALKK
jgi:LEA14-like dessication related protein